MNADHFSFDDAMRRAFEDGKQSRRGAYDPEPLPLDTVTLPSIAANKMPPRRWAYGNSLLFGAASVIGGVDGSGKGQIAVVMALAMVTGKPLLGEKVWRIGAVLIVTYEDSQEEWHRRFHAACKLYDLTWEEIRPSIHFVSRRVTFATPRFDGGINHPDSDLIIAKLREIGAVLLIVDPFNNSHQMPDGNSNTIIALVAEEMSRIAYEADVALLALHHLRKGSNGQVDDLMGATALRANFRSCRILARMTAEEARTLGADDPRRFLRVAGSKENYALSAATARWFRLASVDLGNTEVDPVYPNGDNVGVATSWEPRPMFEGMPADALSAVFAALVETPHSPNRQSKHTPWAGGLLVTHAERTEAEASKIIAAWLANGLLIVSEYYHSASRSKVQMVTLNQAKSAEILALYGGAHAE